jgi:hypothetical protein
MRQGGFAIYQGLPDAMTITRLYNEAAERYPHANIQEKSDDDFVEGRGGAPRRSLLMAEAGAVQDAWYNSAWLSNFLSTACGIPIVPSGNRGSYSYYARPGDFLDLHRDIETCDVAVITVLSDNSDPSDQAGALVLYPNRFHEPLSTIRERPYDGAYVVKLSRGQTIILFGGIVAHRLLPVREGQARVISVLCFRALVAE